MKIKDTLDQARIPYREETFLSGFWGRRFIFPTRKAAKAAEKALGTPIMAYYKEWALEIYC